MTNGSRCVFSSIFPLPNAHISCILNPALSASGSAAPTVITACHSDSAPNSSELEIIFSFVNSCSLHSACHTEDELESACLLHACHQREKPRHGSKQQPR